MYFDYNGLKREEVKCGYGPYGLKHPPLTEINKYEDISGIFHGHIHTISCTPLFCDGVYFTSSFLFIVAFHFKHSIVLELAQTIQNQVDHAIV